MVNRTQAPQPWMACTEEDAEPYKKYKVLYGERKFARNFVGYNQTSLANIDFLGGQEC